MHPAIGSPLLENQLFKCICMYGKESLFILASYSSFTRSTALSKCPAGGLRLPFLLRKGYLFFSKKYSKKVKETVRGGKEFEALPGLPERAVRRVSWNSVFIFHFI